MLNPTKISPYFQHSVGASSDPRILALMSEFGVVGYAYFFILLEVILQTGSYQLDIADEAIFNGIASKLQLTPDELRHFVDRCCELDLFTKSEYDNKHVLTNMMLSEHYMLLTKRRGAAVKKGQRIHKEE